MGDQRSSAEGDFTPESKADEGNDGGYVQTRFVNEIPQSEAPVAPDGGWGWVVVIASFFISVIVDGICYTFGVIKPDLDKHFETSSSTSAWAGSMLAGVYLIVGPIVSALANKFGCRPVCIAGSIIAGVSFLISSWSQNIETLLFTYGVLGGIGFGMMYLPAIVMVGYYFDKRRALATGIAVCGSGIGTFVMAPVASFLLDTLTWRGTNAVLGALILNGAVFGALYRPLPVREKDVDNDKSYIMEKLAKEKRTRYYSENEKTVIGDDGQIVAIDDVMHCSQTCEQLVPNNEKPQRSRHTSRVDDDLEKHARSRHVSKVSFAGGDAEKKPFDRQDALFPGNLMATREFKECGADLPSYVHSVTSLHQTTSTDPKTGNKHMARLQSVIGFIAEMFDITLLGSPTFILICLSGVFVFIGLFTPFVYGPAKAEFLGATKQQASLLLSVLGIFNTVSRIATGFVADLPQVDCVLVHNVAAILAGLVTCLVCVLNSYELLMLYSALFGIFIAAFIALRSIVIVELLGISKLTNAFGLLSLCQGLAVLVGSPIAGAMYDATESYAISFLVSGVIILLGGVVCLPIRRIARWEQGRQQTYDIVKANETAKTVAT